MVGYELCEGFANDWFCDKVVKWMAEDGLSL